MYIPAMSLLKGKKNRRVDVFFFSLDWSDDMTNLSSLVVRIFLLFSAAIPVSLSFPTGPFFGQGLVLEVTSYQEQQTTVK